MNQIETKQKSKRNVRNQVELIEIKYKYIKSTINQIQINYKETKSNTNQINKREWTYIQSQKSNINKKKIKQT